VEPRADPGVVTHDDVLEGELAASLEGAQPGPFRAWRPGSDPAPFPVAPGAPRPRPPSAGPRGPGVAPAPRRSAPDPLEEFFYRPDEDGSDVPDLGAAPAEPAPAAAAPALLEYLTFLLGGEEYAVAIDGVREVIKAPPITEVPRAPAGILGVITVRGEVVVVFDPRRRLGLGASALPEGGRVIVVHGSDGACGLVVDAVEGVVRLPPGALEPCPQGLAAASAEAMVAIGHHRDRIFTVLDLGALVRRPGAAAEGRAHAEPP
jgi:purine-binding chemotaxis protein CheW